MAAKAVLRDAGRVLGFPYGFVDGLAKLIPLQPTDPMTLEDAIGVGERARKGFQPGRAEFRQRYEAEEDVRDLVDLALQLEDLTRNAGKHAGGVVIAPSPLSDFCPLFAEHDGNGEGRNPVTQFDKDDVEKVGLVKFDFLGLRTLTIIDWAVKAINARRRDAGEAPLDIAALPLDDKATYDIRARRYGRGVPVRIARHARAIKAQPTVRGHHRARRCSARPARQRDGSRMVDRKRGVAEVSYPHPRWNRCWRRPTA